ncbi:uncharacterized protein LOC129976763 [Argiope bruennichi]|uniref:Uncharacterized protein n=1 Tax=Argiope bruennichi TaxID=94029 RepID=A0A8T0ESA1_ARGBR|nr:uncharacterized protein LOC129976763 [Argiope bruennichi]KAF8778261.1 hypothetical protein HNY73_015001 [Argiope bruennichi]
MIAILLLSLLQLSTAAVLRQPDSMMLGLDDSLSSMLYEIPEYEDPQMLEYELSQLEDHPIVSLIHLARKHVHNKNRHSLPKEAIASFKPQLDSVITRLQTLQTRLERGSTEVSVEDIEKSIQDLKKLEHIVRPNIDQLLTAMHQGLSHSGQLPQGGLLNVRSKRPPPVEVTTSEADVYEFKPLTTEPPVHEKKPLASKTQVHEIGVLTSKTQIHEIEPSASKIEYHEIEPSTSKIEDHEIEQVAAKPPVHEVEPPVTKPPMYEMKPRATEEPAFALPPPSTEAPKDTSQEEQRRAPYKDEVFKSDSIKERYEMNPYQSRWTWKTASFAK